MDRQGHGRQQLLKKQSGQAMIELLPAALMMFAVLTAAFSYFKVMRSAVYRQEVVRNMAFAAVSNMGSLTTPPSQIVDVVADPNGAPGLLGLGMEGSPTLLAPGQSLFISRNVSCFAVYPREPAREITTKLPFIFDEDETHPNVAISTYAVVHRRAGGNCQ